MNKKIKRDVTYMSIITVLLLMIFTLSVIVTRDYKDSKNNIIIQSDIDLIHQHFDDSLKGIDKERTDRYNADRTEGDKFLWSKAEADTIYFRKVSNLLKWREVELSKIK